MTVQKQVAEELLLMRKEYGTAMLLVTHNIGLIRFMADQVLVLKDGMIQDYGSCKEVLEHPKSAYTRTLLDSVLRLRIPEAEGEDSRTGFPVRPTCDPVMSK